MVDGRQLPRKWGYNLQSADDLQFAWHVAPARSDLRALSSLLVNRRPARRRYLVEVTLLQH